MGYVAPPAPWVASVQAELAAAAELDVVEPGRVVLLRGASVGATELPDVGVWTFNKPPPPPPQVMRVDGRDVLSSLPCDYCGAGIGREDRRCRGCGAAVPAGARRRPLLAPATVERVEPEVSATLAVVWALAMVVAVGALVAVGVGAWWRLS